MSNIINVVNPGEDQNIVTNVQTAVTAAVDGDILVFPSGNFKWDGTITTTKMVSLWGAMNGPRTVLYVPESVSDATLNARIQMFRWDFTARPETLNSGIVVKGIIFMSKLPSCSPLDGLSVAEDIALRFTYVNGHVVRDCKFYYFGNAAVQSVHRDDYATGLIAYNYFTTCKGYDGLGLGYGVSITGEYTTWVSSPQFGTGNFIFIENNQFYQLRHAIAANGGSLYVARNNYFENNAIVGGASQIDAHDQDDGPIGSRATEVYDNVITTTHFKIHQWANIAARNAFVPFSSGTDYGIQLDTGVLYVSTGLSAGNWTAAPLPKGDHLGSPLVAGKDVSTVNNVAILIKGGESVIHNNTITGSRFGTGIISTNGYSGAYPVPYSPGWASGVAFGPSHTGINLPQANGDMFEWDNNFTAYSGIGSSQEFFNFTTSYFVTDRDYHENVAKPGYTTYTYPHPLINR